MVAGEQERVAYHRRRAIVIEASARAVFPWLVQMGYERGGWYAIDRLEKLCGVGRFATGGSARRVEPDLQDLRVGDRMPLTRTRWLEVAELASPHALVLRLPPGRLAWTWRFTVTEMDEDRSELAIVTELSVPARGPAARALVRVLFALFDVGHGIMEGVQLRTLARRVPAAEE